MSGKKEILNFAKYLAITCLLSAGFFSFYNFFILRAEIAENQLRQTKLEYDLQIQSKTEESRFDSINNLVQSGKYERTSFDSLLERYNSRRDLIRTQIQSLEIENKLNEVTLFDRVFSGISRGVFIGLLLTTAFYFGKKSLAFIFPSQTSIQSDYQTLKQETKSIQDTLGSDFYANLIRLNFKYLDSYYDQTQIQANKSFSLSVFSALISLLIIIAGIILLYINPDKDLAANVTIAAGTLGEFISVTIFYLYNRTVLKMGEYHQKLLLTQNIALSLKISETIPKNQRVPIQKSLVSELMRDINYFLTAKDSSNHNISKENEPKEDS